MQVPGRPRRAARLISLLAAAVLIGFGGSVMAQGSGDAQTGADGRDGEELDLREANVTDVSIETSGTGSYRFSVTLLHDDDGEEGYANWWQVESLAGEVLGRRELLHAHGTVEFTRSETIRIPEGMERVVVRGHDQTHGYGGQVAIVDLASGDLEFLRQGSEAADFGGRSE